MSEKEVEFIYSYDEGFGLRAGQVWPAGNRILLTCPNCGQRYALTLPPFTFDHDTKSIGPASIGLNDPDCGWHGYVRNGLWIGDACKGQPGAKLLPRPGVG